MHEALVGYYPTSAHGEIAALLRTSPHQLGDDFIEKVATVAFIVDSGNRPAQSTKKQSRDALKVVSKRVQALIEALDALDPDAWFALVDASLKQFGPYQGTTKKQDSSGDPDFRHNRPMRVHAWTGLLQQIGPLVQISLDSLEERGRPTNRDIPWGIAQLREIWTNTTGTEPTLAYNKRTRSTTSPFLRFCQIVLDPILTSERSPVKLERAVRNELYGQNLNRKRAL